MTGDLDLARAWYATRDRSLWADDAVWELSEGFPLAGTYRGKTAIFDAFLPRLKADWLDWRAECVTLFDGGPCVVGTGLYHGVNAVTGRRLRAAFVHLFTVRDGLLAHHRSYVDAKAFRCAATAEPAVAQEADKANTVVKSPR